MKEYNSIELFVRVVQSGSLSSAARETGVMPSSVSRQISSLEDEVGARLFQRTTRKQSLTEAGVLFYDHALRLTQELSEAKEAVSRLSAKPSGTLNIAMEADFSQVFVAPLLPEFFTQYPEIKLRINLSANMLDLVESGIDVAIRMGHLADSSFIAKKLATSCSVICCSPEFLNNNLSPSKPEDLSELNCLSFKTSSGKNMWHFEKNSETTKVVINGHVNVNSLSFLKQMALANQGVVMMPLWMIHQELSTGTLVTLLDDYKLVPANTPIQAVFPSKTMLAPKVRAFIEFLAERLSN